MSERAGDGTRFRRPLDTDEAGRLDQLQEPRSDRRVTGPQLFR